VKKFNFPASQRLKLKNDFENVFKSGKKLMTTDITLWYNPVGKIKKCRLGIIVSKRLGQAVERNRVKRLIRETFRLNKHLLADFDIILYPRNKESFSDFRNTQQKVLNLLRKAGIYKND